MDKVIVTAARAILGSLLLASLAACGGSETTSADAGTPPVVNNPVNPDPVEPSPSEPTPDPTDPSGNAVPDISGAPSGSILVGQAFSFQPSATDADGDTLTFSIDSKPQWATFDAATGRLWGTPDAGDVGSHEEILITVSDGTHSDTLPQFALTVLPQDTDLGSATLAWNPPTENTDGSALTNLKGYKIHYGTASGSYDTTVTLNNAGLTRYTVDSLPPGTYFFAVTAVAVNGAESALSGEASKTI